MALETAEACVKNAALPNFPFGEKLEYPYLLYTYIASDHLVVERFNLMRQRAVLLIATFQAD